MTKAEYESYLQSDHWFVFSRKIKAKRPRCEKCGIDTKRSNGMYKQGLNVHHKTYDRIGRERDSDVEVLCHGCHMGTHGTVTWLDFCAQKSMPGVWRGNAHCDVCDRASRFTIYDINDALGWVCEECR